ncbi:MAG: 6-carboxytetrahydropterin synthase [Acidobacteriota bacterium]
MSTEPRFTIRLAKEDFKFSSAHFTLFPDGSAELLHGHNYHVSVELSGSSLDECGLLCDFIRVKTAIRERCEALDTLTLVPDRTDQIQIASAQGEVELRYKERRYVFPEADVRILPLSNTSIELLAELLWNELVPSVTDSHVDELSVAVAETAGQSCEYRRHIQR